MQRITPVFMLVGLLAGCEAQAVGNLAAVTIVDRDSGTILIDLWDSDWDAELCWLGNGCVQLDLQRIDRNEWCALVLDPVTRTYLLIDEGA